MNSRQITSLCILAFFINALPCMAQTGSHETQTDNLETRIIILENKVNDSFANTSYMAQNAIEISKAQVNLVSNLLYFLAFMSAALGITGFWSVRKLRKLYSDLTSHNEIAKKDIQITTYLTRAILCITRYDMTNDEAIKKGMAEQAIEYITNAESIGRPSSVLYNWKAYVLRRNNRLSEAIEASEEAAKVAGEDKYEKARALYNAACYNALLNHQDDAISHLGNAIKLHPSMKKLARNDSDFVQIKNLEKFKEITSTPEAR